MIAETYWQVTTDINHIGAEITWDIILEVVQLAFIGLIGRRFLRWYKQLVISQHDMEFHPNFSKEHIDD